MTDFGLSRFLTPTLGFITSGGLKGTTGYWAIEIVRKLCHAFKEVDNETQGDDTQEDEEPTMDCHTQQSDVWAFGMTVYVRFPNIFNNLTDYDVCRQSSRMGLHTQT